MGETPEEFERELDEHIDACMERARQEERAAVVLFLQRARDEMIRQEEKAKAAGFRHTAKACRKEAWSYENAASIIERGGHLSPTPRPSEDSPK